MSIIASKQLEAIWSNADRLQPSDQHLVEHMAIVIVTYNAGSFIAATLKAVFGQIAGPGRVFVIDNASTDDTLAIVREEFPQVAIIALTKNVGFGAANNVGIQEAFDCGAEQVLLLNQDAVLHPGATEALAVEANRHEAYGLLGAFQFTYDGTAIDRAFTPPDQLASDIALGTVSDVYATTFVPAVAVLVRKAALIDIGGFDPLFFMYHEDQDLCRRLVAAGWGVGIVPRAIVRHWNGSTHALRSLKWECNWAYSDGVLHLKSSPRWFPFAYITLIKIWLTSGPAGVRPSVKRAAARAVALARCAVNATAIRRHRTTLPFTFRSLPKKPV